MGGQTRSLGRHRLQALDDPKPWMWPRNQNKMGEVILADALSECLDEMQKNGGNIEAALASKPDMAADIRPLLEVAAMLRLARN